MGGGGAPEELKLVKQFDKDGDQRLDAAERKAAREFLAKEKAEGRGPRRPGIYQDEKGRFHIIPHDANETFALPGGPGFGGEPSMSGIELDPLTGADDPNKPLLHKLLAVPSLRTRYLGYIRNIAEQWLDWNKLGPLAQQYQALIAADVKTDTRKLDSLDAFTKSATADTESSGFRGPRRKISLKSFVEQRRAYLLNHPAVKQTRD